MTEKVLVLRTCAADLTSHGGFVWPDAGPVECPHWDPKPICGYGLHGALWGEGDGSLLSWAPESRWLVVEVDARDIVQLDGKVKFPRGTVVHCGDQLSATAFIQRPGRAVIGGTATAGNDGTATAGDRGTATAGYRGTATAGNGGTATAGDYGVIIIFWYDGSRRRIATGYVGEDGIEPNVAYCVEDGQLTRKEPK